MLLNYLKLSLRLLARNPFFTFINVAGLSVGFAVFFTLWPFTQAELKSDQFIPDHNRIFRLIMDWRWTDNGGESWGQLTISTSAVHISYELKDHEQVADFTRFIPQQFFEPELTIAIQQPDQTEHLFEEENAIWADRNFFEFFGLPFRQGDRMTALRLAQSLALSESTARKFFGTNDPVGRMVKVDGEVYQVTGVFNDLPKSSHLQFSMVFSNEAYLNVWNTRSFNQFVHHYFKMKSGTADLTKILTQNKERLIGSYLQANPHIKIELMPQPLVDVAFSENFNNDTFIAKSRFTITLLATVSLVVLIMAWMNYINLAISRTKTRFKEIAARKVSGALIPDLFLQFICQSAVINLLAALIAITIIQIVQKPFEQLFQIYPIPFSELDPGSMLFFASIFIAGILLTALYPAWMTLKYNTRQLINKQTPLRPALLPSLLTTFQYITALTLVAWIFVMFSQMNFILNKELGFDKENVLVLNAPTVGVNENGRAKMESFAGQIKSAPNVQNVTLSGRVSGDFTYNTNIRRVGNEVFYGIDSHGGVDEHYIPFYSIRILAGRNFEKDEKTNALIVSRFTAERLGLKTPDDAVGVVVEMRDNNNEWRPLEIIGVVEDYRVTPFTTSQNSTEDVTGRGQCFTYMDQLWTTAVPERISVKLASSEIQNFVKQAEKMFNETFPGNIFNWYLLDEHIARQYNQQQLLGNQLTFFTILAVVVACLGLLGMISNKVVEKIKEISIRRILGAERHQITSLLLSSTGKQIGLAVLVGLPIAWKFSDQYLQKFTEQVELQWWHFTVPVLILGVIMFATIASVLWKAAKSNPVEALKYE